MNPAGAMQVRFWGVRGSVPVPGTSTVRTGGNTSCVEVVCGETRIIIDAGTGLRELGNAMLRSTGASGHKCHFLISHTHWDHIQGLPFFVPLYIPGNTLHFYGGHSLLPLRELLRRQMFREFFPVELDEVGSTLSFNRIDEPVFFIDEVKVTARHLLHPDLAFGFRLEYAGKTMVYCSDNELYHDELLGSEFNRSVIADLIHDADLVVGDCQYNEEEYPSRVGWGHSTWERMSKIARECNVKRLAMYHHDPVRSDDALETMERAAQKANPGLDVFAAREGLALLL